MNNSIITTDEEDIEGTIRMLANLIKTGDYGKQIKPRKLLKATKKLRLSTTRNIHISLIVNNISTTTTIADCMVMDNHGDIICKEEAV